MCVCYQYGVIQQTKKSQHTRGINRNMIATPQDIGRGSNRYLPFHLDGWGCRRCGWARSTAIVVFQTLDRQTALLLYLLTAVLPSFRYRMVPGFFFMVCWCAPPCRVWMRRRVTHAHTPKTFFFFMCLCCCCCHRRRRSAPSMHESTLNTSIPRTSPSCCHPSIDPSIHYHISLQHYRQYQARGQDKTKQARIHACTAVYNTKYTVMYDLNWCRPNQLLLVPNVQNKTKQNYCCI